MHKLIRQQYPDLESTTMIEDNKKLIKVVKNRKGLAIVTCIITIIPIRDTLAVNLLSKSLK